MAKKAAKNNVKLTSKTVTVETDPNSIREVTDAITDMNSLNYAGQRALKRIQKCLAAYARKITGENVKMAQVSEPKLTVDPIKRRTKVSFVLDNANGRRRLNINFKVKGDR